MAKKKKMMKPGKAKATFSPQQAGFRGGGQGAGPMNLVGPGKDKGKYPNQKKTSQRGK